VEQLSSPPFLSKVRDDQSLVVCIVFCTLSFVILSVNFNISFSTNFLLYNVLNCKKIYLYTDILGYVDVAVGIIIQSNYEISVYYHSSCDFDHRHCRDISDRTLCSKVCKTCVRQINFSWYCGFLYR